MRVWKEVDFDDDGCFCGLKVPEPPFGTNYQELTNFLSF